MQMAISTIILIVLGVLVLTGLMFMFVKQVGFFKGHIDVADSNVDVVVSGCNLLVTSDSLYTYCCEKRGVHFGEGLEGIEVSCDEARELDWSSGRIGVMDCSAVGCV